MWFEKDFKLSDILLRFRFALNMKKYNIQKIICDAISQTHVERGFQQ